MGKPKPKSRSELCRELVDLNVNNRAVFERIEAIKAELKEIAAKDGKFRETFAGLGHVSVSPAKPPSFKGEFPVLVGEAWLALKDAKRDKLIDDGLVKIEPQYTGAYYGRVDVEIHTTPA